MNAAPRYCIGAEWDPITCDRAPVGDGRCAFHGDPENGSRGAAWLAAKRDARILASERDDLRDALATVQEERDEARRAHAAARGMLEASEAETIEAYEAGAEDMRARALEIIREEAPNHWAALHVLVHLPIDQSLGTPRGSVQVTQTGRSPGSVIARLREADDSINAICHALGVCRETCDGTGCESAPLEDILSAIARLQKRGPDGFPVAGLTSYAPLLARLRETAERIEHSPTLDRTDARFIAGALEIVARLIDEH